MVDEHTAYDHRIKMKSVMAKVASQIVRGGFVAEGEREIQVVRNFLDEWDILRKKGHELPSVKLVWDLIVGLGFDPKDLNRYILLSQIGVTWECWNEECQTRINYGFESKCSTCGSVKILRGERNDAKYWDSAYLIFDAREKAGHNPKPDSVSDYMAEVWADNTDNEIRFKPDDIAIVVAEHRDNSDRDRIGVYILLNGLYAMVKQTFVGDKYRIDYGIAATFDHIFRHYVKNDANLLGFCLNADNQFIGS